MKSFVTIILVIGFSCIHSPVIGYEVENARHQGFTVVADNTVYIITPNNKRIEVTKIPFVAPNYSMPPIEPIQCTWDPSNKWLGIFIAVKQTTEICFYNLESNLLLKGERNWSEYPNWFGEPQWFAHTKPGKWIGNKLTVDTLVKFRDGGERHLPETILINGVFRIIPEQHSMHQVQK